MVFLKTEEGSPSAQIRGTRETEVPEKDDNQLFFPYEEVLFSKTKWFPLLWAYGKDPTLI